MSPEFWKTSIAGHEVKELFEGIAEKRLAIVGRCRDCRYWGLTEWAKANDDVRKCCERIDTATIEDLVQVRCYSKHDKGAYVETSGDFGCVLFEGKSTP